MSVYGLSRATYEIANRRMGKHAWANRTPKHINNTNDIACLVKLYASGIARFAKLYVVRAISGGAALRDDLALRVDSARLGPV